MRLGILTVVVLAVILFGICTATESAGVGAFGALLLAVEARTLDWERTKQAVFLTAKTTAMVCWLFVGSVATRAVFLRRMSPTCTATSLRWAAHRSVSNLRLVYIIRYPPDAGLAATEYCN